MKEWLVTWEGPMGRIFHVEHPTGGIPPLSDREHPTGGFPRGAPTGGFPRGAPTGGFPPLSNRVDSSFPCHFLQGGTTLCRVRS